LRSFSSTYGPFLSDRDIMLKTLYCLAFPDLEQAPCQ
jgi:hypothetical protein